MLFCVIDHHLGVVFQFLVRIRKDDADDGCQDGLLVSDSKVVKSLVSILFLLF